VTTTIQTEEQLGKLRAEGYSEVQGFLLGKPMPQGCGGADFWQKAPGEAGVIALT
jgi:EAL domain-containing protein (putative c-di-GMP-specific phosphodiesterase class I)